MAYDKPELEYIWAEGGAVVEPSDTKKQLGWVAEVPPHQYENWVQRRQDQFIFHVNERGIPEWDGQTNYLEGGRSLVQGSNGSVYKSVAASGPSSVTQDPTTDTANTYWEQAFPDNDDSRLSNAREWTADTVSQAEAQAGTATTRRAWTAQRVRQAITGWWSDIRANHLPLQSSIPQVPDAETVQEALAGLGEYVDDSQPDLEGYLQPSMTGSATLNGTTDNTVQLTDIVTTLGLEAGDVIRIKYSGYDKLHSVESITNNNSIIVNYEHAGNRADGSLKLADETATVTITRISKWYNAPLGLGQAWVDVTAARLKDVNYTSPYERQIFFATSWGSTGSAYLDIDDKTMIRLATSTFEQRAVLSAHVGAGSSYRVRGDFILHQWSEIR